MSSRVRWARSSCARQDADLEICVNDHPAQLGDNTSQGVRIDIDIAEAAGIP